MKKEVLYKYLGTNGIILSPVHLEDVYYVRYIKLYAEKGKKLTKNYIDEYDSIVIPEEEVADWFETEDDGQF